MATGNKNKQTPKKKVEPGTKIKFTKNPCTSDLMLANSVGDEVLFTDEKLVDKILKSGRGEIVK